jgi:hypothetical protein
MAGNPLWAPEEDQRLQALASSGASVAEMAKQMKRSEEAVRSRAYRLKISQVAQVEAEGEEMSGAQQRGTNWTPEEDRRLFDLIEAGKSWVAHLRQA